MNANIKSCQPSEWDTPAEEAICLKLVSQACRLNMVRVQTPLSLLKYARY